MKDNCKHLQRKLAQERLATQPITTIKGGEIQDSQSTGCDHLCGPKIPALSL